MRRFSARLMSTALAMVVIASVVDTIAGSPRQQDQGRVPRTLTWAEEENLSGGQSGSCCGLSAACTPKNKDCNDFKTSSTCGGNFTQSITTNNLASCQPSAYAGTCTENVSTNPCVRAYYCVWDNGACTQEWSASDPYPANAPTSCLDSCSGVS